MSASDGGDESVSWEIFESHVSANDAKACAQALRENFFKTSDFGHCKLSIVRVVTNSADTRRSTTTLTETLLLFWADTSSPIAYLILMALDELEKTILPKDWLREKEPMTHGVRLEVQKLVQEAFTLDNGVSPKVVVKSVALFRIDQVDESHVVAYAHGLLSSGAFISLLKFIEHFSWIKWTYQDMIEQFAATNSWPMAEQLLKIVQPTITAIDHRREIVFQGRLRS
ncbi:Aste57867_6989 [Aphanomyces stellatus]|uniref:Aste57867_6989 protein n=1 Tax=Aphanomyces stellatus TaxID=120398 RepID=A0A485KGA7_9STRA|nr:hypothetical protein As57867_006966 [Aphanomyces stellatus]VFT83941.1 Aste57867_6989 [Aphanomyces stellatus]